MLWQSVIRFFGLARVPTTAELSFGTQCLGGLFASLFGNAAAVLLPPERKSERSYGEHGKRKSAPAARRGQSFPNDEPFGLGRVRPADAILLWLRSRTPFPSAEGLAPRKSGGFNPRLVCAASYKAVWRPHFRFALRRKKSLPRQAAARGKDAARFLPAVLCRSARRPSRKAGPWRERRFRCGLLDAALEAGGLILRAAASDAFDVPPHFQSGIMSGRACPALGFAVRRLMFRCKRCTQGVVDAHSEACEHSRRECVRSIAAPSQGGAGRSPRVMAAEDRQGRVGRALWYADAFQRRASRA